MIQSAGSWCTASGVVVGAADIPASFRFGGFEARSVADVAAVASAAEAIDEVT